MAALVVLVFTFTGCRSKPLPDGVKTISVDGGSFTDVMPDRLYQMISEEDFLLVNVHAPYEGEIADTDLFLPYNEIGQSISQLPDKKAKIVLYCVSGHMSAVAAETLVKLGYTGVWNLHGGMNMWRADGFPLIDGRSPD